MKTFEDLLSIIDQLLGPEGCEWDRKQTLKSMRGSVVEEAYEVVDAIEKQDDETLVDELGDLLFCAVFLSRLAEKEGRGSVDRALTAIIDKLIRRHPHIFGEVKLESEQAVLEQWERLKHEEGKGSNPAADIPRAMPALLRAERLAKKQGIAGAEPITADEFAKQLFSLVCRARAAKMNPEQVLADYVTDQACRF